MDCFRSTQSHPSSSAATSTRPLQTLSQALNSFCSTLAPLLRRFRKQGRPLDHVGTPFQVNPRLTELTLVFIAVLDGIRAKLADLQLGLLSGVTSGLLGGAGLLDFGPRLDTLVADAATIACACQLASLAGLCA